MSGVHARLSPSGADGWMNCVQWASDSVGSTYARRGNAAHELAARLLHNGGSARGCIGEVLTVEGEAFTVDDDMADTIDCYVDYVRTFRDTHVQMVEVRVPIEQITGEPGAHGTVDALLISKDCTEVVVVDLKTGAGVQVDAERNRQMQFYALGALEFLKLIGHSPDSVRLVISQPKVSRMPSEWATDVPTLREFALDASAAAMRYGLGDSTPGETQCRWCSQSGTCSALAARVQAEVGAQLEDLGTEDKGRQDELLRGLTSAADIARAMAAVGLVEDWCSAIRAEAERRLKSGAEVAGFKLVAGKRGIRAWADPASAEAAIAAVLSDHAFERTLVSPTKAERLLRDNAPGWQQLLPLITQAEGKPSVARTHDKRPALEFRPVADQFHDETGADLA